MYSWDDGTYLMHHGTKGQKWGIRKYQNDDGSYTSLGQQQNGGRGRYAPELKSDRRGKGSSKKRYSKTKSYEDSGRSRGAGKSKSDDEVKASNSVSEKVNKTLKERYNLSDEQIKRYKRTAAIIGVSLATTAGVMAVAYAAKNGGFEKCTEFLKNPKVTTSTISKGHEYVELHNVEGFNLGSISTTTAVTDINDAGTFLTRKVGGPKDGLRAIMHGYSAVKGDKLLSSAKEITNYDTLHVDAIVNQRTQGGEIMDRRLSCWSGSHSYILSMLTGKQYCSKNYQTLVEFNSFGSLYNKKMNIIDMFGDSKSDFVGKMGNSMEFTEKVQPEDAYKLVDTIFRNFREPNAKNGSCVGFIDAAYRKQTCTHQWNFEITNNGILNIVDTWSGEKYDIAKKLPDGTVKYNETALFTNKGNGSSFLTEMMHYGRDSFRLYSPKLEDLNLDAIANVVLAKTR